MQPSEPNSLDFKLEDILPVKGIDSSPNEDGDDDIGARGASPTAGSTKVDLELMRLRVLASRKRKASPSNEGAREEGEISDIEPAAGRISLPPRHGFQKSLLKHSGYRRNPLKNSIHGRDLASSADRFLQSLSHEFKSLSTSFDPQACTIELDSDEGEMDVGVSSSSSPDLTLIEGGEEKGKSKAEELRRKELQRQQDLLDDIRSQERIVLEELRALGEQLDASEKVTKSAVETQQRLKAQLKETKELINRGKQLKINNLTRQKLLEKEVTKKRRIAIMLEQSVTAKKASLNGPTLPPSKSIEEISNEASAFQVSGLLETPSIRSQEIADLEKKAQRIRADLMATQNLLLQRQKGQKVTKKVSHKSKGGLAAKKGNTLSALGRVMSIHPLFVSSASTVSADKVEAAPKHNIEKWNSYFPDRYWVVGGELLTSHVIREIINNISGLIRYLCPKERDFNMDIEDSSNYAEDENEPELQSFLSGDTFKPYFSPLRCFRSYRYSPFFGHVAPQQGLLSRTFTNAINPRQIICSHELLSPKGCKKKHCEAQHFKTILLDDASMLEDFLLTLLTMPVDAPYKDQIDLVNNIKGRLLKLSKDTPPLISLVGIILDAHKQMHGTSPHVVSFVPKDSIKLERAQLDLKGYERLQVMGEALIQGIKVWQENKIANAPRYFLDEEPKEQVASTFPIESTIKKLYDGISSGRSSEEIINMVSNRMGQNVLVNELAIELNIIPRTDDSVLGWIKDLRLKSVTIDQVETYLLEYLNNPSPCLYDVILAACKCFCDLGNFDYALNVLHWVAFKRPRIEEAPLNAAFQQSIQWLENPQFRALSALLFFYILGENAYPAGLFCAFPFDLVYREDYYFCLPERCQQLLELYFEEVLELTIQLGPGYFKNWLLCVLQEIRPLLAASAPFITLCQYKKLIDEFWEGKALEKVQIQEIIASPVRLLYFISKVTEYAALQDHISTGHLEAITQFVRVFWKKVFNDSQLDELVMCCSIAAGLGISEVLPDVSSTIRPADGILVKSDPFLWVSAAMTFALLYEKRSIMLLSYLVEAAISSIDQGIEMAIVQTFSIALRVDQDQRSADAAIKNLQNWLRDMGSIRPITHLERVWNNILKDEGIGNEDEQVQNFFTLTMPLELDIVEFVAASFPSFSMPLNLASLAKLSRWDKDELAQLVKERPMNKLAWNILLELYGEDVDIKKLHGLWSKMKRSQPLEAP